MWYLKTEFFLTPTEKVTMTLISSLAQQYTNNTTCGKSPFHHLFHTLSYTFGGVSGDFETVIINNNNHTVPAGQIFFKTIVRLNCLLFLSR